MSELTRSEALEFDIDQRMFALWIEMQDVEEWTIEAVAAFMRAAYGRGYLDAIEEADHGRRAKLCADNGYRIPDTARPESRK